MKPRRTNRASFDRRASGIAPTERTAHICVMHGHHHEARPTALRKSRNWAGPWRRTPGRLLGTSIVRAYQLTLSGFVGNTCRHLPTCSEYAYEAIARHGLWAGGWMGVFRVARCGPFGTHGIDNVPDRLTLGQFWYAPWRYRRSSTK